MLVSRRTPEGTAQRPTLWRRSARYKDLHGALHGVIARRFSEMPLVTILIEDSATIRESLIPALVEVADVEVVAVAETAAEGIAAVESLGDRWRLAVVDLFLREGNGFTVLRAARSRGAHQRMVVLTNFATADIRRRAADAGADAVFDKSTELDLFFELCRTYAAE